MGTPGRGDEMRVRLLFEIERVRELYNHSAESIEHEVTFEQRAELFGEHRALEAVAGEERLARPSLWLTKDAGIYLTSAGKPGWLEKAGSQRLKTCYASGFDPGKDSEVWDRSREAVGGDDFSVAIELEVLEAMIKVKATHIQITRQGTGFEITTVERRAAGKGASKGARR